MRLSLGRVKGGAPSSCGGKAAAAAPAKLCRGGERRTGKQECLRLKGQRTAFRALHNRPYVRLAFTFFTTIERLRKNPTHMSGRAHRAQMFRGQLLHSVIAILAISIYITAGLLFTSAKNLEFPVPVEAGGGRAAKVGL